MFKKSQKKEEKKSVVPKAGRTETVTFQTNSDRRLSENTVEHRSVAFTSTAQYSSMRITNRDFGTSLTSRPPILNTTLPLFDNPISVPSSFNNKKLSIDAQPFNTTSLTPLNDSGYKSYFSRKLTPYTTDARPFNTNLQPSPTPPQTTVVRSPPRSQFLPRNSSYSPETSSISAAPSTLSLPTTNESAQDDQRIPTYNTKGKNRGKVMVINNIKFLQEKQERKGAEMDEKHIKKLFKDMGFEVESYRDLKRDAMTEKVTKFSKDSSLKRVDMSVLIMMSHGSNVDNSGRVVQGGFTQIYGVDDRGLPIDDILDTFSAEKCRAMAGKPKIFIFQCCRGESEEHNLHNDAAPLKKNVVKKHADMLLAFSTLPGFYSIRDTKQGSWYIQSICDIFQKHGKELDVETLLKIVDDQLTKKHPTYQQTSTYESRGFKRCFLNPK